jgi:hypothetical protein
MPGSFHSLQEELFIGKRSCAGHFTQQPERFQDILMNPNLTTQKDARVNA